MKYLMFIFALFSSYSINAQSLENIKSLQKDFTKIENSIQPVVNIYDSLLNTLHYLETGLQTEYEIYKACDNSFKNTLETILNQQGLSLSEIPKDHLDSIVNEYAKKVYDKMYSTVMEVHEKDFSRIREIKTNISNEFGSVKNYKDFKKFYNSVNYMIDALNPGMDLSIYENMLSSFLNENFPNGSQGKILQQSYYAYTEKLNSLEKLIDSYENIPYFSINAYPQYSNDIVDENIKILNTRANFNDKDLISRTQRFLSLSELDLSNSNFSMDIFFKGHKNIKKLNLSNTNITSLKHISEMKLVWLDLSNTNIDHNDLLYLRSMNSIDFINLSNTNLKKGNINELCYHLKIKKKNCITKKKNSELISGIDNISY